MTAAEAGQYLRVEEKTVQNWTGAGKILYVKMGGTTRYRKEEIDAVFSSGLIGNTSKWDKKKGKK